MAWRDSRRSRKRLMLFSASISLGVAALVALGSMCESLRTGLQGQSKALLGADLQLSSQFPPTLEETDFVRSLGGEQATVNSFSSGVSFPDLGIMRVVYVFVLSDNFPFYGHIDTDPPSASDAFRQGDGILISEPLARQLGLKPGDDVRVGYWKTRLLGSFRQIPGDSVSIESLAPRICLAASSLPKVLTSPRKSVIFLPSTNLTERTSNVRFRTLFRLPDQISAQNVVQEHQEQLNHFRLDVDTVEHRLHVLNRSLKDFDAFLNLVAFIALLLGAVGIASAIHAHVQQRLNQVAILRCLGASMNATFSIYLTQALALGLAGSAVGVALGASVQFLLPALFRDLLPVPVSVHFSAPVAFRATAAGTGVTLAFALLPLLAVRQVSPLAAIRSEYESKATGTDWSRRLVHLGIAGVILIFAWFHSRLWYHGAGFAAGLGIAFLLLTATAGVLIQISRRLHLLKLPFVVRQGLASLHRPGNRTRSLLISLGLTTFFILILQFVRSTLLNELIKPGKEHEPNAILFDIRPNEVQMVSAFVRHLGYPVLETVPIATVRLAAVNDLPVRDWAADRLSRRSHYVPNWAIQNDYRVTWRTNLIDSEKMIAGRFVASFDPASGPIPITLNLEIARHLDVWVGDRLKFNLKGSTVTCVVSGIRKVDQQQLRPSMHFVFPSGSLDAGSPMWVLATRTNRREESNELQTSIAKTFPTVSVIDLNQVLETLNQYVYKVGMAIRFMGLFTVLTGVLVLISAIVTGRWQRCRESTLLRTLGASRNQVRWVLLVEYALLGGLGAVTGLLLALGAGWAVVHFVFQLGFHVQWLDPIVALLAVPTLTVIIGLSASRGIANTPPLEILRQDG